MTDRVGRVGVQVVRVPALSVQGVRGHDRPGKGDPVQYCSERTDFVGSGGVDLPERNPGGVLDQGEQMDLGGVPGTGAAARFPVHGNRMEGARDHRLGPGGEPGV